MDVARRGRDGRVAIIVEGVGCVPVGVVVEIDGLGRPVVRPVGAAVIGVGLVGHGRPVAGRKSGERLRQHVAELVVRSARCDERGVGRARRTAAAGNRIGLRQIGVFIDVQATLAGGIEIRLQVGFTDHHPGLGLAALLRAEHEVLPGRAPGAGTELYRLDLVGIILPVVPHAVGIVLAVGRPRQQQVVLRGEALGDVVVPVGRWIEGAAAHLHVGGRDHHHRVPGEFAGGICQDIGRGAVLERVDDGGLTLAIAAILVGPAAVRDVHLRVLGKARDGRQVARISAFTQQGVFELRVTILVVRNVYCDIGFCRDQRRQIVRVCVRSRRGQGLALHEEIDDAAIDRGGGGVRQVDGSGVVAAAVRRDT